MIVSQKMVAETEVICQQKTVQCHLTVSPIDVVNSPPSPNAPPLFHEISLFQSVVSCSDNTVTQPEEVNFVPNIRSGSYTDIGTRRSMDDQHIRIDDLASNMSSKCPVPSAFYGVFDGHGGPEAASFIKTNAMRLLLKDFTLPLTSSDINQEFLKEVEDSHKKAFIQADLALADESSVSSSCGTTALTALVLGRHLLVANTGDCRAVLCKKGVAVDMSQDHRPSYLPEHKRVEDLGGYFEDGYLNGYLSVTRALGDWDFKMPLGSTSPLIADPDVKQAVLTKDDEFLIIGCDGIWDVMSSQCAVSLVRRGLRRHDDPQQSAKELVMEASRLHSSDNLTAIIVCFAPVESCPPLQRRRFFCGEARSRLQSLLG